MSLVIDDYGKQFNDKGFVLIPNVLRDDECAHYIGLIKHIAERCSTFTGGYLREANIIEKHIGFSELLDHPMILPLVRTLMGEHVRIMSTEAIMRPKLGDDPVRWHEDGPNSPPYRELATPPPLCQLKVGYFLNDITGDNAGNLVVMPGSHRWPEGPSPNLPHDVAADGALAIEAKAGTAVMFHNALWHCVQPNLREEPRYSLYYTYCFPWMAPFDRSASSPVLHSLLKGTRRELLMDFENPGMNYTLIKETWRGDRKLAMASPARILGMLAFRRLKRIKRKLLGVSIN